MEKKIGTYERHFTLWGGGFVRTVFIILSILTVLGGVAISKKTEILGSAFSATEKSIFSWETFIQYILYALILLVIGFVVGKLLDIQNAKLELLEMQTENALGVDKVNIKD